MHSADVPVHKPAVSKCGHVGDWFRWLGTRRCPRLRKVGMQSPSGKEGGATRHNTPLLLAGWGCVAQARVACVARESLLNYLLLDSQRITFAWRFESGILLLALLSTCIQQPNEKGTFKSTRRNDRCTWRSRPIAAQRVRI